MHTGTDSTRDVIGIGHNCMVLPGYAKDTTDASHVIVVEYALLCGICSLCLAAISSALAMQAL